jgi:two-component system alkaline phosphatase synthesis response regulator PhoP
MLTTSVARDLGPAPALADHIDTLAAQILRAGRDHTDPAQGAALGAAGAQLRACHARLQADLMLLAREPEQRTLLASDSAPLVIGQLHVDRAARTARIDGQLLDVTNKEFDLLAIFATAPQRVFTKAELYRAVWNADLHAVKTRCVDTQVAHLRVKLGGKPWL